MDHARPANRGGDRRLSYLEAKPPRKGTGPGLPTPGNTHEVAQPIALESKIVYVDNDHGLQPERAVCKVDQWLRNRPPPADAGLPSGS